MQGLWLRMVPGWTKGWAVVACLVTFPFGVIGVCWFPFLVKVVIAGEYEYTLRWYNSWLPRFTWPYVDLLATLFAVFLFLGFTWRGVCVLLGRAGRPRVLDVGAQQLASESKPPPDAGAEGQRKKRGPWAMAVRWVLGIAVLWAILIPIAMWRGQCEEEQQRAAMHRGEYDEIIASSDSPDDCYRCVVIRRLWAYGPNGSAVFLLRIDDRETGRPLKGMPLTIESPMLAIHQEPTVRRLRKASFRWTNGKVLVDVVRGGRRKTAWAATIRGGAQYWGWSWVWEDKQQRTPASTTQSAGDS